MTREEDELKQENIACSQDSSQSGSQGITRSPEEFIPTSSADIGTAFILPTKELSDSEVEGIDKQSETQSSDEKATESRDWEDETKLKTSNHLPRHNIIDEPGAKSLADDIARDLQNDREEDDAAPDQMSSQHLANEDGFGDDDNFVKHGDEGNVPEENSEGSAKVSNDAESLDPEITEHAREWSGLFTSASVPIAIEVEDNEDHGSLSEPAAVATKLSPQSKPHFYKSHPFRFYSSIALAVLLFGVCCIVIWATLPTQEPDISSSATWAPASIFVEPSAVDETSDVLEQLIQIIGESNLAVDGSPEAQAARWMIHEDPLQLSSKGGNLKQRFLLVLFYFSTTAQRRWRSCNQPVGNETADCVYDKMTKIYPERNYIQLPAIRWLSEKSECEWFGVFCNEYNQVSQISLPGQDILGTLPSSIALLPSLRFIVLVGNDFYGKLPRELALLNKMEHLVMSYNFFTGEIPSEWWRCTSLQMLNMEENMLSGNIPTEMGLLTGLTAFYLSGNDITGTIPTEIGNLKLLTYLRWASNDLTGTIPSEIGDLTRLKELWLLRNELSGTLPSEIGNIKTMKNMRLHRNAFSGTIPEEHYDMINLALWDLYDCNFTDIISTKIEQMSSLEKYRIRRNNFYGTIPSELGGLRRLSSVWMHENNFSGTIPRELCRSNLEVFMDCHLNNDTLDECSFECCVEDGGIPREACFDS